jgi:hypothetical protein
MEGLAALLLVGAVAFGTSVVLNSWDFVRTIPPGIHPSVSTRLRELEQALSPIVAGMVLASVLFVWLLRRLAPRFELPSLRAMVIFRAAAVVSAILAVGAVMATVDSLAVAHSNPFLLRSVGTARASAVLNYLSTLAVAGAALWLCAVLRSTELRASDSEWSVSYWGVVIAASACLLVGLVALILSLAHV